MNNNRTAWMDSRNRFEYENPFAINIHGDIINSASIENIKALLRSKCMDVLIDLSRSNSKSVTTDFNVATERILFNSLVDFPIFVNRFRRHANGNCCNDSVFNYAVIA